MEKLTFYALSAPEKLDRIGAYLSERLSRDVARHRYGSAATFPTVSALKKKKKKERKNTVGTFDLLFTFWPT